MPLAIERHRGFCRERAFVNHKIIKRAGEERSRRRRRATDEYAILRRKGRGSGGAADRQLSINIEGVAVGTQRMHDLMPLTVGVAVGGATTHLAVRADQQRRTDFTPIQEQLAVTLGDGRIDPLRHAEETAVGASGLEPEHRGQPAFGQVERLEVAQQVVAVKGGGGAIGPVHPAGGASGVETVDARLLAGAVFKEYRLRQVVERQPQQGDTGGKHCAGRDKSDLDTSHGGMGIADRARQDRAVGQLRLIFV